MMRNGLAMLLAFYNVTTIQSVDIVDEQRNFGVLRKKVGNCSSGGCDCTYIPGTQDSPGTFSHVEKPIGKN